MKSTLTLESEAIDISLDPPQHFTPEDLPSQRKWTLDIARAALKHIHPDCDFPHAAFEGREPLRPYQLWRNIGSALIGEFGKDKPETFTLFDDFSSGRLAGIEPDHYKSKKIREQFNTFDASKTTMGTVEWWAKKGGWNPDAELLERLKGTRSISDPLAQSELINEVARAPLSVAVMEACLEELKRITGLGKTAVREAMKEAQREITQNGDGKNSGRESAADVLVRLGLQCELWKSRDPRPELFATVDRGEFLEHMRLYSSQFKRYLINCFFDTVHKAPSAEAVSQALSVLAGHAQEKGKAYDAFLRVARYGDSLYLDLADEQCNVVEITKDNWSLVKRPPVRLIRGAGKALPIPTKGGKITDLRKFINIDPKSEMELMKIAAWLVAAFRPGLPFPILLVTGEQGSAKTMTCKMLKSLVDPSAAQGRGLSKTEDDLIVTARTNHVMMADNLSGISGEMADAICRLSTGGGNAKRELYSDGEEYIIEAKRPFIINGINIPTNRQDLLDRSLLVELPPIGESDRKPEDQLLADFEKARPSLLGVLLDGVVGGLRNSEALRAKVKTLPRMADFALFAAAAMRAWGLKSETFLDGYTEMRSQLVADAGRSDAVLSAVCDWIQGPKVQVFEGTATLLLTFLGLFKPQQTQDKAWVREVRWPKEANHLSRRIRSGASGLRAMGIGYEEAGTTKMKLIRLWWGEKRPSFTRKVVAMSPEMEKALREDTIQRGGFG